LFDPCVLRLAVTVDKYQAVAFESSRNSMPRALASRIGTVKIYVEGVVIIALNHLPLRSDQS
jgi:hypothetical protein